MAEDYKYMLAGVAPDRYTVASLMIMVQEESILRGKITESTILPLGEKTVFQVYFDKKEEDPDRIQGFKDMLDRLVREGDLESGKIYKRVKKEA